MRAPLQHPTRATLAATLLSLYCAPLSSFAVSPMQPGLWELRAATTLNKQELPPEGTRECLSQADIDHPTRTLPKPDASCALSNITVNGNRMNYDIACTREEVSYKGQMELIVGSASYDGMADFKVNAPGKTETPMSVMVNARRVGDCTK